VRASCLPFSGHGFVTFVDSILPRLQVGETAVDQRTPLASEVSTSRTSDGLSAPSIRDNDADHQKRITQEIFKIRLTVGIII
jgi:hypothetical protein